MRSSRWCAVVLLGSLAVAACSRSATSHSPTVSSAQAALSAATAGTATTVANQCANAQLQATDVGVTPTTITIEVMADAQPPQAPGLFQGNIDAINAFAAYVNTHGGLACRRVLVRSWDSKLDPIEAKNGQIDSCRNALAMVGTLALVNPDITTLNTCPNRSGEHIGLPDIAAATADVNEQCGATVFSVYGVGRTCPLAQGTQTYTENVGFARWAASNGAGLHGLYLVGGDSPSTIEVGVQEFLAMQKVGITWDATPKVTGTDTQSDYTPRVLVARAKGSTIVYNGANDVAMVRMRKEADAQGGLSAVKFWACTFGCYTNAFLAQGGSEVEGTYIWMGFLPFEEAGYNAEEQRYVDAVGPSKVDSFGADGWMAAVAFEDAVNAIVARDGPNALTRANLLTALTGMTQFDAHGWLGEKPLHGGPSLSPCFLVMQVQHGKFVRVYPTKPGTMDCSPANLTTITVDVSTVGASLK